jgi:hypothetical protein
MRATCRWWHFGGWPICNTIFSMPQPEVAVLNVSSISEEDSQEKGSQEESSQEKGSQEASREEEASDPAHASDLSTARECEPQVVLNLCRRGPHERPVAALENCKSTAAAAAAAAATYRAIRFGALPAAGTTL